MVITAAMCLIYAGFGALFTPIYDTVFATVAPGQNGRAVAMNDLAMQGSAAIGIGVFTPWLASGSFESIAVVCVGAAAIGILGDWPMRPSIAAGADPLAHPRGYPGLVKVLTSAPTRVNPPRPRS